MGRGSALPPMHGVDLRMSPGRGQLWLAHQAVVLTSCLLHTSRRDCAPCPGLLCAHRCWPCRVLPEPCRASFEAFAFHPPCPFHGQRRRRDRNGGRCGRCRRRQPRRAHPARRDAGHRYPRVQPHPVRNAGAGGRVHQGRHHVRRIHRPEGRAGPAGAVVRGAAPADGGRPGVRASGHAAWPVAGPDPGAGERPPLPPQRAARQPWCTGR